MQDYFYKGVIPIREVLISSFDMEIGGVERSLIGLLENFSYEKYKVDLMLYRHHGEFMSMLPQGPELLEEIAEYTTFRKPVSQIIKEGHYKIASARIAAKYLAKIKSRADGYKETGNLQIQMAWKYAIKYLPALKKEYDVAVSYLWPHYFVSEKVNARKKIAWIHTDYSTLEIDNAVDARMWEGFDWIVAVSEGCRAAFLKKYPQFEKRTVVIENIASSSLIRRMSEEDSLSGLKDNGGSIRLITVARLSHAKGIDDAVRACRRLLDEGYSVEWYVVGYGNEEKGIRELINTLKVEKNFILLGKKINPYPYIKACDIYVQPSRYEGKAVTVTEAQILGKPVVITSYPTSKSQLEDGVDGYICPLGIDGIVEGVKRLLDDAEFRDKIACNASLRNYGNENEVRKLYHLVG